MEEILQKWPILIFILYLSIFFPVIVLNTMFLFYFLKFYLGVTSVALLPPSIRKKMFKYFFYKHDSAKRINRIRNIIRASKNIQKDITDLIPIFIFKNTVLKPYQKFIFEAYRNLHIAYSEGLLDGIQSLQDGSKKTETKDINFSTKVKMFLKFQYTFLFIILFFALPVVPGILFLIVIIKLF